MRKLSEITNEEALQIAKLLIGDGLVIRTSDWVVRPLGEALDPNRPEDWSGLHVSHPKNDYYLIIDFEDDGIEVNNLFAPDLEKIPVQQAWKLFQLLKEMGVRTSWMQVAETTSV